MKKLILFLLLISTPVLAAGVVGQTYQPPYTGPAGPNGGATSSLLPQGDIYIGPNNVNTQSNYIYVGGLAGVPFDFMPVNVTPGDVTAIRLSVGNSAFGQDGIVLITGTPTHTSGTSNQVQASATLSPTGATSASFRSIYGNNALSTANNFTANGVNGVAALFGENRVTNSGTVNTLSGVASFGLTLSSQALTLGTVTTVNGVGAACLNSFSNSLTSTITNCYGIHIYAPGNNGTGPLTLVGVAGLDIEEHSGGTNNTDLVIGTSAIPSGNYAIYSSSSRSSSIAGNVGIGTASPATTLDVNGDITMETGTAGALLCLTTAHALGHCTAAASCTGTCTCTCSAN